MKSVTKRITGACSVDKAINNTKRIIKKATYAAAKRSTTGIADKKVMTFGMKFHTISKGSYKIQIGKIIIFKIQP